tara:strand:+ start:74 stop:358 length:285 start_codon:yes stop_codon:yes gene_type:complete
LTILKKFKEILSASPLFLIFFGVLGYLIYSDNFDKKMIRVGAKIQEECYAEVGKWQFLEENESYFDYVQRWFPCRKRKLKELGLYERYVNWSVN